MQEDEATGKSSDQIQTQKLWLERSKCKIHLARSMKASSYWILKEKLYYSTKKRQNF